MITTTQFLLSLFIVIMVIILLLLFCHWVAFNTYYKDESRYYYCFLSFRRFKILYNLNPSRYKYIDDNYYWKQLFLVNNNSRFEIQIQIKFHFIDFICFLIWNKKNKRKANKQLEAEALAKVLKSGIEDIERIKKKANEEIIDAKKLYDLTERSWTN